MGTLAMRSRIFLSLLSDRTAPLSLIQPARAPGVNQRARAAGESGAGETPGPSVDGLLDDGRVAHRVLKREADLDRYLPVRDSARLNVAARVDHFKPAHVLDRPVGAGDGVLDRVLHAHA